MCTADGVMYWEDVTETLAAFIEASPPGGALLMQSKGAIAVQLASFHDIFLPQVHASMSGAPPAETFKVRGPLPSASVAEPWLAAVHQAPAGLPTDALLRTACRMPMH